MLEKIKSKVADTVAEVQRKKEEQERLDRERRELEAKREAERLAAERERLMNMSEKELLVEVIMNLQKITVCIGELSENQGKIAEKIEVMEDAMRNVESNVSFMCYSKINDK